MVPLQSGAVVERTNDLSGSLGDSEPDVLVSDVLQSLLVWLGRHGLASYDYADILRSSVVRRLTGESAFLQRVAIQLGKRCPVNFRPLIGVTPHLSSQTLALLCSARAWQFVAGWPGSSTDAVRQSADTLLDARLGEDRRKLWGMNLHFAARFWRASPTTPNLFQTSNAIHALLDAYHVTKEERFIAAASDAVAACVTHLGIIDANPHPGQFCRYYPDASTPCYNVNALFAAASWRLSFLGVGDAATHAQRAASILEFVLGGQRSDGAWPYAAHPSGQWVDGYHTGYVLEGLGYFLQPAFQASVLDALQRGVGFFQRKLIDTDGCPKHFDNSRYPIDVQNCAQGIQTIARLQPLAGLDVTLLHRVIATVVRNIFVDGGEGREGYFAAMRGRYFVNRTPYVRWGQAPMVLALTFAWTALRGGRCYFPSPASSSKQP